MSILQFLDNHLNPLFLRELRQLVRNRFIIVLINLFIAILVLVCMIGVLFQPPSQLDGAGAGLFAGLAGVMMLACFLAVVVYTATTTASERINGDLMYASAMKPSSIVLGKAWAGVLLTVLLMSITAPFVTLAYLLRGLDIEQVVLSFLYVFGGIQIMNAAAIGIFANAKSKLHMAGMLIFGFFVGIPCLQALGLLFMTARFFGRGTTDVWQMATVQATSAVALIALFLSGAIASLSPPTSNRILPLRLTITAIYIVSLLLCLLFPSLPAMANPLEVWTYTWAVVVMPLLLLVVCDQDTWSYRIKKTVPKKVLFRVLAFPFYTGAPNGLVWVALLGIGMVLMAREVMTGIDFYENFMLWWFCTFDYCVAALLLRVFFLSRWIEPTKTWTLVLILLLLGTLGSMLAFFLVTYDSARPDFYYAYENSVFSSLNPFVDGGSGYNISLPWVPPLALAALLTLPLFVWFVWKVRLFSPFAATGTMTLEEAEAAVREADANPLVQSERERERKLKIEN